MLKFILSLFKKKDFATKHADIIKIFTDAAEKGAKLELEIEAANAINEKNARITSNILKIIE